MKVFGHSERSRRVIVRSAAIISVSRWLFVVCGLLFAVGCQKEIEPKSLPQQDPRIVINCVLTTDSTVHVKLSSSKSIVSGKPYKMLSNAYCAVYENGQFWEQLSGRGDGLFVGTKLPVGGRKYQVVARNDGYKDVDGSSLMPAGVNTVLVQHIDSAQNNLNLFNAQPNGGLMLMGYESYRVRVKDNPDTRDYYFIYMNVVLYDTSGAVVTTTLLPSIGDQSTAQGGSSLGNSSVAWLKTDDQLVNGDQVEFDVSVSMIGQLDPQIQFARYEVRGRVGLVSEDYYKYQQTADEQMSTGASPFSEPTIVYNNINNGMGIVCCLNAGEWFLMHSRKLH